MRLLYIERGTTVKMFFRNVENETDDENEVKPIKVEYVENADERVFYIQSREMFESIKNYANKPMYAILTFRGDTYRFNCMVQGKDDRPGYYDTVVVRATTRLTVEQKRSTIRIDTLINAKIHDYKDTISGFDKGLLVCECIVIDISMGGIHLNSDIMLKTPIGTMYVVEFSLIKGSYFNIPVKYVRGGENNVGNTYRYDLRFAFDYTKIPHMRDKLITSMFESRLDEKRTI
jgi:hypothetical protein